MHSISRREFVVAGGAFASQLAMGQSMSNQLRPVKLLIESSSEWGFRGTRRPWTRSSRAMNRPPYTGSHP